MRQTTFKRSNVPKYADRDSTHDDIEEHFDARFGAFGDDSEINLYCLC